LSEHGDVMTKMVGKH